MGWICRIRKKFIYVKYYYKRSPNCWRNSTKDSIYFCNVKPTFINGFIRKIEKTNINYIKPNKIIIKGTTFLAFNHNQDVYVKNLQKRININDLQGYIKSL